jgi:triosephosphate isomerase
MVKLIAQNISIFDGDGRDSFARTGGTSCFEVKKAGATGIIIGHSEVGDDSDTVNKKLKSAIANELFDNILLVGESWAELGKDWQDLSAEEKQKIQGLVCRKFLEEIAGVSRQDFQKIVVGYEPAWGTRGSGKAGVTPPQAAQVQFFCSLLRKAIAERFDEDTAGKTRVIYGGSMTPERAAELMGLEDCDGFILGSAGKTVEWTKKIADAVTGGAKAGRKPVLCLNWKAYRLQEPYAQFIQELAEQRGIDAFASPNYCDLALLKELI